MRFRKGMVAGLLVLLGSAACAEELSGTGLGLRSTLADDEAADGPASCAGRAALFIDRSFKVWVTRKGTIRWSNPLRPLSPETLIILQVAVNGRAGSAFGADFDNLRQGSGPRDLHENGAEAVRWAAGFDDLPREIRVIADDGRVLLGPMHFQACGTAPRVAPARPDKAERPLEETVPAVAAPNRTRETERRRLPMPQGAIR